MSVQAGTRAQHVGVQPQTARAPGAIIAGVFLACYLSWRPSRDIMFTASDMLFLLGAWALVTRKRMPAEPLGEYTALWFVAFATMLTGLLIGSFSGGDPVRWVIVAVQYTFAWVVLPFLLMGHQRHYTMTLARALLAGVVAMELVGVIVFMTYQGTFEEARAQLGFDFLSGSRRLGAFATDANWNGAVVAMTLPLALFLAAKGLIRPVWAAISVAILAAALLMTASFTAFVATVLAVALFAVAGAVRPRLWMVVLVLGAGVLVARGDWAPATFQKRVGNAIEQGDLSQAGTFNGRVALMQDAWEMARDHLIVGVGVDQSRVESKLGAPVHNMYLLLLVEGGVVALLGWVAMMVTLLVLAVSIYRHDRYAGALAVSVTTTFLIYSVASPHMYARLWAVPVLMAVAIARSAAMEVEAAGFVSQRQRALRRRLMKARSAEPA